MCALDPPGGFTSAAPVDPYVKPGSGGNGTLANPKGYADFIKAAGNRPGTETVWLTDGTYTGTFTANIAGATYRAAPGHAPVLSGGLVVSADNVTVRDLIIADTTTGRTTARTTSVSNTGAGFSLINCVLLDGSVAIFSSGTGATIQGNITNGQGYQAASNDRGHGHSAYIQNAGPSRTTIADNIFGPGYGWSAHAYSQTEGQLTKMDWLRNTAWGAGYFTANPHETYTWLMAGVAADDYEISDNYLYGHGLQLRYGSENSSNLAGSGGRVDNGGSYIAPGALTNPWSPTTWTSPVYNPGTLGVYVHANAHETGRANITVFNPNDLSSTTADCTGIIGASDPWYLYDGFNPLAGPVSSGTGPTVTVPMTGLTCRTPAGCSAPTHPCPKFGAFVVRSTPTWVAP